MTSRLIPLVLILAGFTLHAADQRLLYITSPDGAQKEGNSGTGILIFDINNGHRFVRRIEVPGMRDGVRGFCGNLKTHRVYYSTTGRRLGCLDLLTDKVVWERQYDAGCDRSSVTLDGSTIYVPTGWWWNAPGSGFLVVDAATGTLRKRIPVGPAAHNSLVSLDGQFVFLGTTTNLTMFRVADDSVVRRMLGVGEAGVFPFTVDSRNRYAYVCLGKHVGFDIVDLETGTVRHRVFAGETKIPNRTHGAGLTPDETELWISDQVGKKLFVFDATQMPPKQKAVVELSEGGHGWVCFSLDGQYAWSHTPDVIDARTKKIVATLRDETGKPVSSSKYLEIHFRDGQVVNMGNEFALGRAHRQSARGR